MCSNNVHYTNNIRKQKYRLKQKSVLIAPYNNMYNNTNKMCSNNIHYTNNVRTQKTSFKSLYKKVCSYSGQYN